MSRARCDLPVDDNAHQLSGPKEFIKVVIGISWSLVHRNFQAMYTAVMERTREIGILKAMGAPNSISSTDLARTVFAAIGVLFWASW